MNSCPNCGHTVEETDTHCNTCGASLHREQQSQSGSDQRSDRTQQNRAGHGGRPGQQTQPAQGEPRSQPGGPQDQGAQGGIGRRELLAGGVGVAALGGAFLVLDDSGDGGSATEDGGTGSGLSETEKIRAMLREHEQTLDQGDVDAHMETLHPESPVYDQTRATLTEILDRYPGMSVTISIESVEVLGDGRGEARVVQTTRAEDPDFRDNRLVQTFDLRTYNGEWRVYDSTIEDREYL